MTPPLDPCPFCDAAAVDVTVHGDPVQRFICAGAETHEWTLDDLAPEEPEPPNSPAELPVIFHRDCPATARRISTNAAGWRERMAWIGRRSPRVLSQFIELDIDPAIRNRRRTLQCDGCKTRISIDL